MDELTDQDLELLEAHLDGALPADTARDVEARLSVEPALVAEMVQLRAERAMRRAAWSALEPSPSQADAFAQRICAQAEHAAAGSIRRPMVRWPLVIRWSGAVAACLLVGFMTGYIQPGRGPASTGQTMEPPMDRGSLVATGPAGSTGSAPSPDYHVSLMDPSGRVLAEQRFGTLQQAHEFAEDVRSWQMRQYQNQAQDASDQLQPAQDSGVKTVAYHF